MYPDITSPDLRHLTVSVQGRFSGGKRSRARLGITLNCIKPLYFRRSLEGIICMRTYEQWRFFGRSGEGCLGTDTHHDKIPSFLALAIKAGVKNDLCKEHCGFEFNTDCSLTKTCGRACDAACAREGRLHIDVQEQP